MTFSFRSTSTIATATIAALTVGLAGCQASLVAYDVKDADPADGTPVDTPDTLGDDDDDDDDDTTSGDDDDDDDLEPIDIALDAVDPWYGTTGHEVRITGGPFAPDTVVQFEGLDATVIDVTTDAVTVLVPDLGGDVDEAQITAQSGDGESPAALAFRYFEDATDRIGAVGTVEWFDYRGGYWEAGTVDSGFAHLLLTLPTDFEYEQIVYALTQDTCERDWSLGVTTYVYDPVLPNVVLQSGGSQLVLPADPVDRFVFIADGLAVQPGAEYDLQPMSGSPSWPDIGVPGLVGRVPSSMSLTSPNIDGSSFPTTSDSITLQWAPPYDGDAVLVQLQRLRYDGAAFQLQESVTCWLSDDGFHIVPANSWTDWDTGSDYVFLAVGRANEPQSVLLPHNNGRSDVLGIHWAVGFLDAN